MKINLVFETRELSLDRENSRYNCIFHKIKTPFSGCDYLVEVYDDVSDCPYIKLGYFKENKFIDVLNGESDGVPEDKETCGGVFVVVELYFSINAFSITT